MGVIGNLMFAIGFKVASDKIKKAERDIDRLSGGMGKLDNSIEGTKNAVFGLGKSFSHIADIGAGMLAGLSFVEIGQGLFHAADDANSAFGRIQAATGATAEQMEATKSVATNLYNQNFGENWDDLGKSISIAQQITKQQGEELENTTRNALLMRDVFEFDIPESVKTADTMYRNFGVTTDEAFNLLAQGAQKGLDKSGELLDTANEYSPYFRALGFSANEMFDTFSAGLDAGAFNLDKVGDAVKEFNIRAKDGSKTTTEAFEMLGLNAEEMMKTFASGGPQAKEAFGKILQMIAAVEDPVDKNTIGVALMGTQFEDLEATVVEAMGVTQNQFDMTKDTMSEINNIKFENTGQALAMIGRQLETGVIQPIGNLLLPLLSSLSVAIGFVIDHFDIFGPALAAFGIIIAVAVAPALLGMAAAGWAAIAPWLPFIGIAVAVGAAVAGLVYAWKNNMFGLQDWTNQALEKAKAIFDSLLLKVNTVFSGIKSYIDSIMPYIQQIFETVMPIVKAIFLTHLTIMGEVANLVFNTAWDIISWALNNIWNLVSIVWTAISGIFKAFLQFITGDFSGAFSTLQETIGKVFEGIKTYFVEFVGGAIDIGKNFVQGLIQGVLNSAGAVWDAVTSIGKGMKDSITSFLDIHSPSRVMMEVGYFTGEGLAQGIASTEQQVNNASLGLAEEIVSPYDQQAASAPASAPAAASYAAGGSNQSFHFVIEVKGDTPVSQQSAVEIKNELAPAIQEIIESARRRLSIAGGADLSIAGGAG